MQPVQSVTIENSLAVAVGVQTELENLYFGGVGGWLRTRARGVQDKYTCCHRASQHAGSGWVGSDGQFEYSRVRQLTRVERARRARLILIRPFVSPARPEQSGYLYFAADYDDSDELKQMTLHSLSLHCLSSFTTKSLPSKQYLFSS